MLRYTKIATAVLGFQLPAIVQEDAVIAKVGGLEIPQSELALSMNNLDPQLAQLSDEQKTITTLSSTIDVKLLVQGTVAESIEKG